MEQGVKDLGRGVDEIRADVKQMASTQATLVAEVRGFTTWAKEKREEDRCRDVRIRKLEAWKGWLMGAIGVLGAVVAYGVRYLGKGT